jgi:hypothetical protein
MATQDALNRRLRRLIDDTGHGYSQSAPGFSTNLAFAVAPLNLGIQIDDDIAPGDISLGAPASLATGQAIASAMQTAIRAADTKAGYTNCTVTFDRKDGYIIRSGTAGSISLVRVVPPTAGTDASELLLLGQSRGGYESAVRALISDDELNALLDEALAIQNDIGTPTWWDYATIPPAYETLVVYRAWSSVVDIKLGQSANYHWQKVESEESHEEQIFGNFIKLAEWLKKKIDELQGQLEGGIEVTTATRWDYPSQQYLAVESHNDVAMHTAILAVSWESATTALVELGEILSTGFVEINVGYKVGTPVVIDRAAYNDPAYSTKTKGFVSPSVLARVLKTGRNPMLRITGLDNAQDTYIAAMAVDVDGVRYFSNEIMLAGV